MNESSITATWQWLSSVPLLNETLRSTPAATAGSVLERLMAAAALGGVIGLEREFKHRAAGLRTNMFMCFGAALFTMLSVLLAPGSSDPTRIASQIIAGIGFIGAGSILRGPGGVQGVTTAATIFVVAAIGMCTGAGLMFPAGLATILVLFALGILGLLEQHVFVRPYPALYQASAASTEELYPLVEEARRDRHSRLLDVKLSSAHDPAQPDAAQVEFTLEAQPETHRKLVQKLRTEFDSHRIVKFSSSLQE